MNGVTKKWHCCDEDEWWETLKVCNSTLLCQLDTRAHGNVINISQPQHVEPNAQMKKTKQILGSFSQHRMTPRGYTTLPVRFKDRESWVKFYVIDSKQNRILSHACPINTNGYDSSNWWSIGANGTIGTNRKAPYSKGSVGAYASNKGDLHYFPMWPGWVQGNSNGPLVPMVRLVPMEKHPIPMVLLVKMHLIKGT